jgi:hypothetical protein
MTEHEIQELHREIEFVTGHFEVEPWTDNIRLLRPEYDANRTSNPKRYLDFVEKLSEILRQGRVLFLHSALNKVCLEEGMAYRFKTPYQANMTYSAVMKKGGSFYILDEDGHYREIFVTEKFARFVEEQYWELLDC